MENLDPIFKNKNNQKNPNCFEKVDSGQADSRDKQNSNINHQASCALRTSRKHSSDH